MTEQKLKYISHTYGTAHVPLLFKKYVFSMKDLHSLSTVVH